MTKQNPCGRFMVVNYDQYKHDGSDFVPAGRYDKLFDAINHAESVTYSMIIIDNAVESRGIIYCNRDRCPTSSPWGSVQHRSKLAEDIWSVQTASHGGIWISDVRLVELTELLGYEYPTFCGKSNWFEEDCDWCIPVIAFRIEKSCEGACKQLRDMSKWTDSKYKRAYNALVAAGKILDIEKVKPEVMKFFDDRHEARIARANQHD